MSWIQASNAGKTKQLEKHIAECNEHRTKGIFQSPKRVY